MHCRHFSEIFPKLSCTYYDKQEIRNITYQIFSGIFFTSFDIGIGCADIADEFLLYKDNKPTDNFEILIYTRGVRIISQLHLKSGGRNCPDIVTSVFNLTKTIFFCFEKFHIFWGFLI